MQDPKISPGVSALDTVDNRGVPVKAIIFDLGNVLIDFNHKLAAERISRFTDKTPQQIYELFFDSELTGLFEEGRLAPKDFFLRVKETLNARLRYEEFVPIWDEIFFLTEKNRGVYNLAKALKERYKVALLSNINILHFDYLKKTFPHLFGAFHHIVTSYEAGIRKPSPLIYQRTLGALGVLSQETFYTDDRPELTASAKELGIRSFVFQNVSQLTKDLLSCGVEIKTAEAKSIKQA